MTPHELKVYTIECLGDIRDGAAMDDQDFINVCHTIGSIPPDALLALIAMLDEGLAAESIVDHLDEPGRPGPTRRQQAELRKEKEKLYCIVYGGARLSLEAGDDPDKIRAENMAMVGPVEEYRDELAYEDARGNVAAAVEDALAKRPPRYTRWFSKEAREQWGF